jgi:polygalacturonase
MKSTKAGSAQNGLIRNCTVRNGVRLLPATTNYPGMAGGLVLGTAIAPAMQNITHHLCIMMITIGTLS